MKNEIYASSSDNVWLHISGMTEHKLLQQRRMDRIHPRPVCSPDSAMRVPSVAFPAALPE